MKASSPVYRSDLKPLVLAFDIEKLGHHRDNPIIEIGAAVVSPYPECQLLEEYSYSVLDMTLLGTPAYTFEKDCMQRFWHKPENWKIMTAIDADSNNEMPVEMERFNMIQGFIDLVTRWEYHADDVQRILWRVTDNHTDDPSHINACIERYAPNAPCLPYHFHTGKYGLMPETHSLQWGILLSNPKSAKEFKDNARGTSRGILKYFDCVPCPVKHDHRAKNDAYGIAYDMQVCLAIGEGRIHPRDEPLSDTDLDYLIELRQ